MRRWLLAAGLLLVALVLAGRADRPSAAPSDRPATPPPAAPRTNAEVPDAAGETVARPLRDLFRYADEAPAVVSRSVVPVTPPEAPAATPEPPVRLVGLVRQSGGLRAVLAIRGELVLLRPGETAEGWTLVAVDEGEARLRGPDGHEETVPLPE